MVEKTIIAIIMGAGIGIGYFLYKWFHSGPEDEEAPEVAPHTFRRNASPPRRRWSPPPDHRRESSTGTHRRRAISPPRETPPTSTRANRVPLQPVQSDQCRICDVRLGKSTRKLDCGHIFDDECYTIWRYAVVMRNPQAILCPSCPSAAV